jgi:phage terminase large subunit GpA-like protein
MTPGPGYCHFPMAYQQEFFNQLPSEEVRTRYVRGHPVRYWFKPSGKRNEALDRRVYALAALHARPVPWECACSPRRPKRPSGTSTINTVYWQTGASRTAGAVNWGDRCNHSECASDFAVEKANRRSSVSVTILNSNVAPFVLSD